MENTTFLCSTEQFQRILGLLQGQGYTLLGPTVRNDVIVLDTLQSAHDLPIGWMDEQEPGKYRLKRRSDEAYFGYNLGPHSWKQFLFPPCEKLLSAKKNKQHVVPSLEFDPAPSKMAFIGVHPCEIQALKVQDKVFQNPIATYEQYVQRRKGLFIVAVNCTRSVSTCFCASMGTGPALTDGFDIGLTEIIDGPEHYFVAEIGSEKARALCAGLQLSPATEKQCLHAKTLVTANASHMVRQVDNGHVHEMLMKSWDHARWDHVAARCVNCTNCTMVCPTCFCSERIEVPQLDGTTSQRCQFWDSCYTLSHSYMHGGSIRQSAKSRYRQWLTHKFGTWWDQFGVSGCVGCGRCITWCPVGIDVTEELHELQR
jgi:ferredoxin